MLCDICGVDYPDRPQRFDVVYNLLSMSLNQRIRLKLETDENEPVPSATGVYSAAGWWEREAWDLFGIYFRRQPRSAPHPDRLRVRGASAAQGFPADRLCRTALRRGAEARRLRAGAACKQEFRSFDFLSPWEGMDKILPGDEKAGEGQPPPGDAP